MKTAWWLLEVDGRWRGTTASRVGGRAAHHRKARGGFNPVGPERPDDGQAVSTKSASCGTGRQRGMHRLEDEGCCVEARRRSGLPDRARTPATCRLPFAADYIGLSLSPRDTEKVVVALDPKSPKHDSIQIQPASPAVRQSAI